MAEFDKGRYFPVFAICQGFEILNLVANGDDPDTLSKLKIYGESRPVDFAGEPASDTWMFKDFPESSLTNLAGKDYAFHAHDYVVSKAAYEASEELSSFFKIVATDTHKGETFVVGVEARNYPIAGVMFHPETQTVVAHGRDKRALEGKVNNGETDAIMYNFSELLHREALKNLQNGFHKFADVEQAMEHLYLSQEVGLSGMYTSSVLTYGLH